MITISATKDFAQVVYTRFCEFAYVNHCVILQMLDHRKKTLLFIDSKTRFDLRRGLKWLVYTVGECKLMFRQRISGLLYALVSIEFLRTIPFLLIQIITVYGK